MLQRRVLAGHTLTSKTDLIKVAEDILQSFVDHYGSESDYMNSEGKYLTKEETENYFIDYLQELDILDQIYVNFGENFVSPTSIVHSNQGKSKVNIKLPIQYVEGRMVGVLHHEIGTHYLRKYNDRLMPWNGNRKKYDLKPCVATEEGFASVN